MKKSAASSSATSGVTLSLLNYVVARIASMGDAIELFPCELTSQYWRKKKEKKKRKRTTKAFIRERRDCKRPDNVWPTHTPGISENSYRSARAFRHLALLTIIRGPIRWPKRRSRYYAIMFHESSRNFLSLFLSFLLSFLSVVSFLFCPARCLTREKYTRCSLSFSLYFFTSTHFAKH